MFLQANRHHHTLYISGLVDNGVGRLVGGVPRSHRPGGQPLAGRVAPEWLYTLSQHAAAERLSQTCDRWIYSACLCFGLDLAERERSGFRYAYSVYQVECSRNLLLRLGG